MKKMSTKYVSLSILLIITLAITSCTNDKNGYDASGTFETSEVIVSSEGSGKIMRFDIDEGSRVEAGQLVGYIDSTQLVLKKKQLQASMKSLLSKRPDINIQIAALEQQLETARYEKRRFEELIKYEATSQKQLDDINAQVAVLEKQIAAQKISLEKSDIGISGESESIDFQIAQLDDQIKKCNIISPIKGIVLVKYSEKGELATQGKALFKIADMDTMNLKAYVTYSQLTKIKIGQDVEVYSDYGQKEYKKYPGKILWISDKSEFTPKTIQTRDERDNLVYAIKASVKNDGYLKIGMYGKLKIGN